MWWWWWCEKSVSGLFFSLPFLDRCSKAFLSFVEIEMVGWERKEYLDWIGLYCVLCAHHRPFLSTLLYSQQKTTTTTTTHFCHPHAGSTNTIVATQPGSIPMLSKHDTSKVSAITLFLIFIIQSSLPIRYCGQADKLILSKQTSLLCLSLSLFVSLN